LSTLNFNYFWLLFIFEVSLIQGYLLIKKV
jgi:hypothetical protein